MSEPVVLLHGFASSHRAWGRVAALLDAVRYSPVAPDLRGHGASAAVRPVTFTDCVGDLAALAPERFVLCGYSLGGRLALHAALAMPERISRLVLVSASPGIVDAAERGRRRAFDEALAQLLEREGVAAFAARWRELPLFAGDPREVVEEVEREQLAADAAGLAASLRGMGAGTMAPLWRRLGELDMPVVALAGERDSRYVAIAGKIPGAVVRIVPGAGHRLPLEAPEAIAGVLS